MVYTTSHLPFLHIIRTFLQVFTERIAAQKKNNET